MKKFITKSKLCVHYKVTAGLISWQEELEELQAIVDAERDKFSQQRETVQQKVTTKVTEVPEERTL